MFQLIPLNRRREDIFGQLARSLTTKGTEQAATSGKETAIAFRTNIYENEQSYLIEAELPGFTKEEIEIDYTDSQLTIKAVHKKADTEEAKQHQVVRQERRSGEYVRRFYAENIAEEGIKATLKDGILTLEVPKRQKPQPKRIDIQVGA